MRISESVCARRAAIIQFSRIWELRCCHSDPPAQKSAFLVANNRKQNSLVIGF